MGSRVAGTHFSAVFHAAALVQKCILVTHERINTTSNPTVIPLSLDWREQAVTGDFSNTDSATGNLELLVLGRP